MLRYIIVHVFYDVHYKRASTQKLSRASRVTCFCFIKWYRTSWLLTYWCCSICVSKIKKNTCQAQLHSTLLPFLVHAPIEYSCRVVTERKGRRQDSILTWMALLLAYHIPPSLTNFSPPIHFPLLVTLTLFTIINTPISGHQTMAEGHHQFALIVADSS